MRIWVVMSYFFFFGCAEKEKEIPSDITWAEVLIQNAAISTQNTTYQLKDLLICEWNREYHIFTFEASNSLGVKLKFRIDHFQNQANIYSCTQPEDNYATESQLGSRFNGCWVEDTVPGTEEGKFNEYKMHRDEVDIDTGFEYTGQCSINVKTAEESGNVAGTVTCPSMIETMLNDRAHYPVDLTSSHDVQADFSCTAPVL